MKSKEIQDIINFIKKTDLDDVSIETENYKIRVKKNKTNYTTTEEVKSEEIKPLKKIESAIFFLRMSCLIAPIILIIF